MNKTETVIATNESMKAYCSETTDGKRTTRSVTISRASRYYLDLCDLLDTITATHQAKRIKYDLFDALVHCPRTRMISITITCFLQGCKKGVLRRIMRSHARRPQRSIIVKQALSDPGDFVITATILMYPHQYWKIEQRFFPDLQKG